MIQRDGVHSDPSLETSLLYESQGRIFSLPWQLWMDCIWRQTRMPGTCSPAGVLPTLLPSRQGHVASYVRPLLRRTTVEDLTTGGTGQKLVVEGKWRLPVALTTIHR